MARINTNVSSLLAQHNLNRANSDLQTRLQRLSTGLRINRGADDPAGLIISERLRSEIRGVDQAIKNAERAANVIATAEGGLSEVAQLLNSIKGLVVEAANTSSLSREEIEANQLQIDSAVDSITRIANTSSFGGLKLLNGALDYITSGVPTSAISDISLQSVNFGTASTLPVSIQVVASAQKADLFISTGTLNLPSALTIEVAGNKGVEVLQFASGTALSAVAFAINRASDSTGVSATIVSGAAAGLSALQLTSLEFGSDAFVSVAKVAGTGGAFFQTFDAIGVTGAARNRDTGEDVLAIINGNVALGQGTKVKLNNSSLKLEMQLDETYAQTTNAAGATKSFTITGGGADFQLGPSVESSQQVSLGIQSISANRLGDSVIGFLSSIVGGGANSLINGRYAEASDILDKSITQISVLRGRLGSFERNTLQTNVNSLQISLENLTSSESRIRDTDFASEISALNRAQVLTNVGNTMLATANSTSQNVLRLLQ
jgi:flagellin